MYKNCLSTYWYSIVFSWDHFKPYLSLLGPVVWILEWISYLSVTYQGVIFACLSKFRDPNPHILGENVWGHYGSSRLNRWAWVHILKKIMVSRPGLKFILYSAWLRRILRFLAKIVRENPSAGKSRLRFILWKEIFYGTQGARIPEIWSHERSRARGSLTI